MNYIKFISHKRWLIILCFFSLPAPCFSFINPIQKHRVIISTDIGGSDPDDFQSMIHLFLYADTLDIVGLVSSPPQNGRKESILEVIDAYEKDYPKLKKKNSEYPTADYLRSVTRQGALTTQLSVKPEDGISEGVKLIIDEAKKRDSGPLYILVWGSITDIAQALHAAPDIKSKIRVYYIGAWNTQQDSNARNYVYDDHPDLWLIENNTTFRGMYMGGYQENDYGNERFISSHLKMPGHWEICFAIRKAILKWVIPLQSCTY